MSLKKVILIASSALIQVGVISLVVFGLVNNSKSSGGSTTTTSSSKPITTTTKPDVKKHTVSFDTNGGSLLDPIVVDHGSKIDRPKDPIRNGYTAAEWKFDKTAWDFSKNVVNNDMTLSLDWIINTYTITYNFNGGSPAGQQYRTTYTINSSFSIGRPTKNLNVFTGWFSQDGKRIDSIVPGMTGDLVLSARWVDNLQVHSLDESRGSILVYGSETSTDYVTVVNIPVDKKCHVFKGWYNDEGATDLASLDDSYTFKLDSGVTKHIYSKYMDDSEEEEWNIDHCSEPTISGSYFYYGLFPQNVVSDSATASILNGLTPSAFDGYYHYRGEYYAKQVAKLARDEDGHQLPIREFDDGSEIVEGNTYWFKLEPIKWRILSESGSIKIALVDKLLTVQKYNSYTTNRTIDGKTIEPANYKYSSMREWLNGAFMNSAFTFADVSPIQYTEVDNSQSSTSQPINPHCCENTTDKIYELSYKDYLNPDYGFSSKSGAHSSRQFLTTDYARAQKAAYETESGGALKVFSGYCWTRSPVDNPENYDGLFASRCNKRGTLNFDYVGETQSCVQPAMKIVI